MSQSPELTDDEENNEQLSIPTSSSEAMSISPKSTSETEQSQKYTKAPLIISDIHDISKDVEALDFEDHRMSYNVQEKIVIALDRSAGEETTPFLDNTNNSYSPLSVLIKAIEMFVQLKSSINKQHEFALVLLEENKAAWFLDFTSNVNEVMKALNSIKICEAEDVFNLNSLFDEISTRIEIPHFLKTTLAPPYVVRTILVYNRSYTCPEIDFTDQISAIVESPYFNLDVLVTHEPIDATNHCEKIFSSLQNIDKKGYSYFFSVGRDVNALMRSVAKLVGHPLQRPIQKIENFSFDN